MDQSANNYAAIGLFGCVSGIVLFVIGLVLSLVFFVLFMTTAVTDESHSAETAHAVEATDATGHAVEDKAHADVEAEAETEDSAPIVVEVATAVPTEVVEVDPNAINRLVVMDDDAQVMTVASDGGDKRQLTTFNDGRIRYWFPGWSPDGQSIAVIGSSRAGDDGLYIFADEVGSDVVSYLTGDLRRPIYYYWSPNSEQIAWIMPHDLDTTLIDLRIAPRDGSDRSRFLTYGQPMYWDWDATGEELLVATNRSLAANFVWIDADSADIGEEIAVKSEHFQSPDVSADNQWFAYAIEEGDDRAVIIENRETGEQFSGLHEGNTAFEWHPTENQLAYVAPTTDSGLTVGPLRLLDTQGNDRKLIDDPAVIFHWSPDGQYIAYLTIGNLFDVEPQAAEREVLGKIGSADVATQPVQQQSLSFQLWVLEVETGERKLLGAFELGTAFVRQYIPFFDQYARSHRLWSPNSDALAFPIEVNGETVIYRFPLEGEPTEIAPGVMGFWSHQ